MKYAALLIPLMLCAVGTPTFASQADEKFHRKSAIECTVEESLADKDLSDKVTHIVHCSGSNKNSSDNTNTLHSLKDREWLAEQVNSRFRKPIQSIPIPSSNNNVEKEYSDDAVKEELLSLFEHGLNFTNLPLLKNASAQKFEQYVNAHYEALVTKSTELLEREIRDPLCADDNRMRIGINALTYYRSLKDHRDIVQNMSVETEDEQNVTDYDEKIIIINKIKPRIALSIAHQILPTSFHMRILPTPYRCTFGIACGFALIGAYTIISSFFCDNKICQHTATETNDNLHV